MGTTDPTTMVHTTWLLTTDSSPTWERRIPLLWFIQHGSLLRIPVLHGNDGSHYYGSYNMAPYYGFQSYMGTTDPTSMVHTTWLLTTDSSPTWDLTTRLFSRFGRMMPNMYSAGCPSKMNSMNRNFVNQFYRNSGSYMSGCPLEMNSMYGNFDNQFNRFPGSYMSSFGQY